MGVSPRPNEQFCKKLRFCRGETPGFNFQNHGSNFQNRGLNFASRDPIKFHLSLKPACFEIRPRHFRYVKNEVFWKSDHLAEAKR